MRFPHSEISGSKIIRHLPEAYRRQIASFIAILNQGIHRTLLTILLGKLKTTLHKRAVLYFITFVHTRYLYGTASL